VLIWPAQNKLVKSKLIESHKLSQFSSCLEQVYILLDCYVKMTLIESYAAFTHAGLTARGGIMEHFVSARKRCDIANASIMPLQVNGVLNESLYIFGLSRSRNI